MASSMMDWTPTNALVLNRTKRTFDSFIHQPEPSPVFDPYVGQYIPGGWPASPGQSSDEGRTDCVWPEAAIHPPPANILVRAVKRLCLGIASRLPVGKIPQIQHTTISKPQRSPGTLPPTSPEEGVSHQQSFLVPNTPQSLELSTILSSSVPSSFLQPDNGNRPESVDPQNLQPSTSKMFVSSYRPSSPLSEAEEHDKGHTRNANEDLEKGFGLVEQSAVSDPSGEKVESPYLHCADWKLLRKLGLMRTSTPPDSPTLEPANKAPNEIFGMAVAECEMSPLTPPATPPVEAGLQDSFQPATDVILRSPYPVLVPSMSLRSPFKFRQTPGLDQSDVYLPPGGMRQQRPFVVSRLGDQSSRLVSPPQIAWHKQQDLHLRNNLPKQYSSLHSDAPYQPSTPASLLHTLDSTGTPSAQLLADMQGLRTRDRSPILEIHTPDPYHESPSSPLMSGELSVEQQSRYLTRSVAKQKAEAARHLNGYNIVPLSKEWEAKVEHALKHGHGSYTTHDLIKVVPPAGSRTTSQWLNDETINGYLKLVTDLGNRSQTAGAPPKYHAFTSFFMTTLLDKGYEGIKRWSKRAKIDGKKLYDVQDVFIPVNRNFHWTMLVVSPKNRIIHYYDSLGGHGREYAAAALQWLRGELGIAFIDGDWQIEYAAASPMQNNSSDCGVFAITTAKQLMLGRSPMAYGAQDIPVQRRRIVAELVAGKLL